VYDLRVCKEWGCFLLPCVQALAPTEHHVLDALSALLCKTAFGYGFQGVDMLLQMVCTTDGHGKTQNVWVAMQAQKIAPCRVCTWQWCLLGW
jgi:hypothetical protein